MNSGGSYQVIANGIRLVLTTEPWQDVKADALVLSANNRLILRGATGLAGWLNEMSPTLHDRCQQICRQQELRPMRGVLPGYGIVTNGPDERMIIHAVTVDYDHPDSAGSSFAGVDTVSAGTSYAMRTAINHGFTSIAFTPMCTRGHADRFIPTALAQYILPQVQAQVIFGHALANGVRHGLEHVIFCVYDPEGDANRQVHFNAVKTTWMDLERRQRRD